MVGGGAGIEETADGPEKGAESICGGGEAVFLRDEGV